MRSTFTTHFDSEHSTLLSFIQLVEWNCSIFWYCYNVRAIGASSLTFTSPKKRFLNVFSTFQRQKSILQHRFTLKRRISELRRLSRTFYRNVSFQISHEINPIIAHVISSIGADIFGLLVYKFLCLFKFPN